MRVEHDCLSESDIVEGQEPLSAGALSLWIDGTLFPMLPQLRKQIKARLNLWDYVEYED